MKNFQPAVEPAMANKGNQHVLLQQTLVEKMAWLKQQGEHLHNPVQYCFIESLIHRSLDQRDKVRDRLLQKAQRALDEYRKTFVEPAAKPKIDNVILSPLSQPSSVVVALLRLRQALTDEVDHHSDNNGPHHDLTGSIQNIDDRRAEVSFSEQLIQQEQALFNGEKQQKNTISSAALPKLKAGVAYQQFQQQQRVDHFIDSAFHETPENPGPLNPEILAVKLLKQINDLSPAYISRYVGYFETLQWLAQEIPPAPKKKK